MSAVSGLASKGEKGKSKFQSLDINSLYRTSLGESAEPQQKTLPRKHGMQSLGKVPSARRPPANLPSLKSEHSGQEPPVSLVPSGGAGWGAKGESEEPGPSSSSQPVSTTQHSTSVSGAPTPASSLPPSQAPPAAPPAPNPPATSKSSSAGIQEKLWSSLMSGSNSQGGPDGGPSFLAHQNPMFQQEFPSLSTEQGAKSTTTQDVQYGPGPSLRPQTEGSWMQGGMSRAPLSGGSNGGMDGRGAAMEPGKGNSGPLGAAQQPSGPGGPAMAAPLPPQLRGIIPPFMYRGNNFGPGGGPPQNFPPNFQGNGRQRYPDQSRQQPGQRQAAQRPADDDGLFQRPIIKEEDLKQMDEVVRDNGWATADDIDYNQKLSFSDEEGDDNSQSRSSKQSEKQDGPRGNRGGAAKQAFGAGAANTPARLNEDEMWRERRRQQSEEVALAVERARQRKEEEEKRFNEQKEAAAKKLEMLEKKMGVTSSNKPEQAEKEVEEKQKASSEGPEPWVKQVEEPVVRQEIPQVYPVEAEREVRKERPREAGHENVAFSSKFSEDLPPRFAKQKQMLMRTGGKPGQKGASPPPPQANTPPPLLANPVAPPPNFEQRWNLQHFTTQGRGQGRRRSSQEQEDFEDQKGRELDKHRHSGSSDRHERDRFPGGRRDGRKISEGSRGPLKDKSDDDHFGRQLSSEERSDPSDLGSREKDFGMDRMELLQQPQMDPFDEKDLSHKLKDATPPPLITDMTLKGKPQRQGSDKWPSSIQHQRQDSERSDDSRGKRGPKPDAWSRGDDSLAAKLRGDDDSRLDMSSPKIDSKKDDMGKLDDDRKGGPKSRGQRGERGPRTGQMSGRDGRDNREGRENRENRDSNWSGGGVAANAFQKTWARTGSGAEGKPLDSRGKGRGSKLHPAPGGKPGKAWEDDSDRSDEEIVPKDTDRRVRKPPKQLKDGPDEKKGTLIGDKKMSEKLSGKTGNKEGFAPRGEPSRRGRGGGGGSSRVRGGVGRGIDGYGPPAKSPFGNRDENRKPEKMGEDVNKTKLGGMVPLSNSVANAAKQNKQPTMPPRMQKAKDGSEKGSKRRGKGGKSPPRGDKPPSDEHNEEHWESCSESEEDQDGRGPRKGASPRANHFNINNSGPGTMPTSKAPGAEKKNGLGSVGARNMNQGKKDVPLTEAAKRLEKEKSALDALDISTYAAVTSLVDDKMMPADQDGSQQYLSSYNYQKKKRTNSPPRDRGVGNRGGKAGPFGQQPPPQHQQQMGMKPGPKSGNYERSHDRSRVSKLPPRLAKQKEHTRMQKAAAGNMPHHMGAEMLDMYVAHDAAAHMNSWDKSLTDSLRTGSPLTSCVNLIEADGSVGGMPVSQIAQGEGEDTADMKLDFAFDSELLEDKNKIRAGGHSVSNAPSSSANSIISPSTAELNLKIASVKKVWENATMPTVMEHSQDEFSTAGFEQALDSSFKEASAEESVMQADVSYSGGQAIATGVGYTTVPGGMSATSLAGKADPATTSSNVCKVKPQQQQMAMSAGQSPIGHQNQLSPPPFNATSNSSQHGHLGYPTVPRSAGVDNMSCWQHTGSATPAFGGISAIPSPPTVLFNTNQQLAQAGGIYNTFLEGQRSQFSQYPPYGLGNNNAATGFSQQSLYMQQPPPPPPTAQGSDMYAQPSLSQYRLQATAAPYGQTQHVSSNPSTVLISTSSNSLMSASVKPSSQPIGAIGSKGYQTSAPPPPPQPNTMYIYEHPAANLLGLSGPSFMSNSAPLVQRQNQVQNNVVPNIQAPSSYFSNSAPGQGTFYQTNNPPPHPNAAAGGLHNSNNPYTTNLSGFAQNTGNTGNMAGFGTTPQQMAAAAAAVQSYRNSGGVSAGYMKSAQQGSQDLGNRQLKSPAQDQMVGSVFSNTQMNASPKGRNNPVGGNKQPPLPSPTLGQQQNQQQGQKYGGFQPANSMHKMYTQGLQSQNLVGGRNSGPRGPPYPSPIQRPNFQNQNMPAQNRPRMPSNQQQRGKPNHSGQGGSNLLSKMDPPSADKQQLPNSNKETNGAPLNTPTSTSPASSSDPKKVVEKKAAPVVAAPGPATPAAKPVVAPAAAAVAAPPSAPVEIKEESITKEESSSSGAAVKAAQCVE